MKKKYAIGIDLGTSNSAAAVYIDGKPVLITSDGVSVAGKMLPSCVAFLKSGQVVVGATAKNQLMASPERIIYQAKRHMGTDKTWTIDGQEYRAQQVAACILRKIKSDAEKQLGGIVEEVVVTVPAQFDDAQRVSTMDAVRIADLKLLRLINEPTAAAISYESQRTTEERIFVVDVGGGTVDTTVLALSEQVYDVVNTDGDTHLGGLDIDRAFMQGVVLRKLQAAYGKVPVSDVSVYQRIRQATQNAKIELSTLLTTNILLPYLFKTQAGDIISANIAVDRAQLQSAMQPFIAKLRDILVKTLAGANMRPGDITKLILVGGPTQMPLLRQTIQKVVGISAAQGINPNHCVAIGAARQASLLAKDANNSTQGAKDTMLLLDVTPLALGIQTENDVTSVLIPRASKVPTAKTQKYTTASNNQTEVHIRVVQGQRYKASDNKQIGEFVLKGIPPMKRGEAVINVTFDIDSNGVVSVSAEEETTKIRQSITIQNSNRLAEEKIQEMIRSAQQNEMADADYRNKVEAVHAAKMLVSRVQTLKDEKEAQLSPFEQWRQLLERGKVLTEMANTQIENLDVAKLSEQTKAAEQLFVRLLQKIGKPPQGPTQPEAQPEPTSSETA